jgi:hypothetical protein
MVQPFAVGFLVFNNLFGDVKPSTRLAILLFARVKKTLKTTVKLRHRHLAVVVVKSLLCQ